MSIVAKPWGMLPKPLFNGKARKAEAVLGWNRHTVELGLNEFRTTIRCLSDFSTRGKSKVEAKNPQLLCDIQQIMEPHSESDSHLRTTLLHTNMTVKSKLIPGGILEPERAANFVWKGKNTVVHLIKETYEKGVKLTTEQIRQLKLRLQRSENLKWWDIIIAPKTVF